jgi:hypothetical protein
MDEILNRFNQIPIQRVLLVWKPWPQPEKRLRGWRESRRQMVEYRANPRSVDYMLARADNFIKKFAPNAKFDLWVDASDGAEISERHLDKFDNILTRFENIQPGSYDLAILLYSDPLGLGWERTERGLLALQVAQYLVLNGRGRIFIWDAKRRSILAKRRWLLRAWGVEFLLAPIVVSVSLVLSLYDFLRFGKKIR